MSGRISLGPIQEIWPARINKLPPSTDKAENKETEKEKKDNGDQVDDEIMCG